MNQLSTAGGGGLLGLLLLGVVLPALGLAAAPSVQAPAPAPRVVVLGTVQDGGLPQAGCSCANCRAARRDPARRRHVASLALHLPAQGSAQGRTYLVDVTPDLGDQLEMVHAFRPHPPDGPDRAPVDGALLTHAHIGHYLGLAFFGFESISTRELPVWASPRMAAYLAANGPWSELVRRRNIVLRELRLDVPLDLGAGLSVTPFAVPHRDELSDTLAYVVRGPRRSLLYVPDTDSWRAWTTPLPTLLARERIDIALLDGTFFAASDLPDRDVRQIGHPWMGDTMDLLTPQLRAGRLRVYFTHLNHSNPALDPAGPARRALEARGFHVLEEGQAFEL